KSTPYKQEVKDLSPSGRIKNDCSSIFTLGDANADFIYLNNEGQDNQVDPSVDCVRDTDNAGPSCKFIKYGEPQLYINSDPGDYTIILTGTYTLNSAINLGKISTVREIKSQQERKQLIINGDCIDEINTGKVIFNNLNFNYLGSSLSVISQGGYNSNIEIIDCIVTNAQTNFRLISKYGNGKLDIEGFEFQEKTIEIRVIGIEHSAIINNCQFQYIITTADLYDIGQGGVFRIDASNQAQVLIINSEFYQCQTDLGHTINTIIHAYVEDENSQLIFGDGVLFDTCSSNYVGGGLNADIRNGAQLIFEGDCKFIDCSVSGLGGGLAAQCLGEGSLIQCLGELLFDNCSSFSYGGGKASLTRCESSVSGGGIYIYIEENEDIQLTGEMQFTNCIGGDYGGGMYIQSYNNNSNIHVTGQLLFDNCTSIRAGGGLYFFSLNQSISFENIISFKDCSSQGDGGGISACCYDEGIIEFIGELNFDNCSATYYGGGGYFFATSNGHIVTNNIICNNCKAEGGGGIYIFSWGSNDVVELSQLMTLIELSGIITFVDCIGQYGGGLYIDLYKSGQVIISNRCTLLNCSSILGNGGGIFSDIISGTLNIENATFDSCSCTQPGNGGGIALIQGISSIISITNSSFINCKTISNSSDQSYGWGGAIFIQTSVTAENLNESNFLMRDLVFNGCSAVNSIGNNIHIQSSNTYNTGIAIALNSLLTVKDTPNLYTSPEYSNDYMGIDESKVIDGNEPYSVHEPLFLAAQTDSVTKQYYIRSFNSFDENECSSTSPCKTTNYILSQSPPEGFVKGLSVAIINQFSIRNK
ncbi:MAG: hypothetical protein EZS28_028852, partial [Streblomastix strix]